MNSSFFSIPNWTDLWKGLVVAIFGSIVAGFYTALNAGTFDFTWVFIWPILRIGLGAGLAYLLKNVFSNSNGQPFTAENGVSKASVPTAAAKSDVPVDTTTIVNVPAK